MKLQNTIIGLIGLVGFAIVLIAGDTGYATWEVGESPIIILTQHGGSQAPSNIPDRVPGCYDSVTTTCIWTHDCPTGTIAEDDVHCGDDIITTNDDKSAELATCIRDNVFLSINTIPDLQPHLIKNELKRRKLDTNREIGPAALGVPIAEQAYNEFYDFVENATTDVIPILSTACDWGLIIDVHGQTYDYQSLGYKVSANKLNDPTHLNLAPTVQSSSIRHLVQSHPEVTFSDVLYGPYSLGTFLESEGVLSGSNYTVYPSSNHPNPIADGISNSAYHQGDYTLETYGSSGGGYIDAIQLEVSHEIRIDGVARQQFCLDFSNALVNFVKHWYGNISSLCAIDLV